MANLVSLISNALVSQQNTTVQQRPATVTTISKNPFANPFVNDNAKMIWKANSFSATYSPSHFTFSLNILFNSDHKILHDQNINNAEGAE